MKIAEVKPKENGMLCVVSDDGRVEILPHLARPRVHGGTVDPERADMRLGVDLKGHGRGHGSSSRQVLAPPGRRA